MKCQISEISLVWVCIDRAHAINLDMLHLLYCIERQRVHMNVLLTIPLEYLKFIRYY